DTVVVTYFCDMATAIGSGGFAFGDTLYVISGYFGTTTTPNRQITMQHAISSLYAATDTIVSTVGGYFDYQYYTMQLGTLVRENYYNFTYAGPNSTEAEDREFTIPNKSFEIDDT